MPLVFEFEDGIQMKKTTFNKSHAQLKFKKIILQMLLFRVGDRILRVFLTKQNSTQ